MSIEVNGYTLNDVGEAADWSPVEVALLTAFANLMPPAGSILVGTEHVHKLIVDEFYESSSIVGLQMVAGNIIINPDLNGITVYVKGTTGNYMLFDPSEECLFMYDSKAIAVGKDPTDPDGKVYSDGTDLIVTTRETGANGSSVRIKSSCSGHIYLDPNGVGRIKLQNVNAGTAALVFNAGVQILGARVVDARIDDTINSGDATTDGVIDAIRDAIVAHGLCTAA
jgi:hypothetical protein